MSAPATITEVLADPEDPGLVRVRVGRALHGPLRRDEAERLRVEAGRRWTATLARAVQALTDSVACRADALRRLGRRDHSRALLTERLEVRWGAALAARVVEELHAQGWLDDGGYARRRAEHLRSHGPISREMIAARLEAEGVDAPEARRAAGRADRPEDIVGSVRAWKRARRDPACIARTLGRCGFDFDTIVGALRAAGMPCPSED